MKKQFIIGLAFISAMLFTASVYAADYESANPGDSITIDASSVSGAQDPVFNPSPQVTILLNVGADKFATAAVHRQALDTTDGKEYGMAYDSTKIYFYDVSAVTTVVDITTSSSTAFSGTGWAH